MEPAPLHATCIAFDGAGVLITGASGSGKSALALQLMAYGAALVADDRVVLTALGDEVLAQAPKTLEGLIEARGVGVLSAQPAPPTALKLVVDMDALETERIPPQRNVMLQGHSFPLFHRVDGIHFAPAILQFLKSGRSER